jgi:hypothetical protein
MPSPEHAADLERILFRAAEECEALEGIWFGHGLPQVLRLAMETHCAGTRELPAEIAFVEVHAVTARGHAATDVVPSDLSCPLVGLSQSTLDELGSLFRAEVEGGVQLSRLICPIAVFDFGPNGVQVREVRHGLTAADLQERLVTPLHCGPDLKELGSH